MIWCLHGNIGRGQDWSLLSQLELTVPVRKVDLWRFQECESIGLEKFGELFSSEVQAQDSEPYLIGYSMGGRLALHAALAAPHLWKGVGLISTHPGLKTESERIRRRQTDAEWSVKAHRVKWSHFLQEWNAQAVLDSPTENIGSREGLFTRRHAIARAFNAWSLGSQDDLREASSAVSCPVSLITGERDPKYTSLNAEFQFPNCSHHVISGAGHRTLWDAPSLCLPLLDRLIS